jgi:cyclase
MIANVRGKVQALIQQGKSVEEVLAAKPTSAYDAKIPGALNAAPQGGTSADRFVRMLYSELKK